MFIKKLILFLLLVTPLLANDSDTKIIINVNNHPHYLPDSVSKQILDVYFVNKDSIEDIITDRSTTDFTVGKAELPDIIGGIRFVKTDVNDEVDIYADASDGRFTVSTTWEATLVNLVAGLFYGGKIRPPNDHPKANYFGEIVVQLLQSELLHNMGKM